MLAVKTLKICGWLSAGFLLILIVVLASGNSAVLFPDEWAKPIMFSGVLLTVALFVGAAAVNWFLNQRILMRGNDAEAKLLTIQSTGNRINDNPEIAFGLEVRPQGFPAFAANASQVVKHENVANLQPGKFVFVRFVPGNDKVVIAGLCPNPTESIWSAAPNTQSAGLFEPAPEARPNAASIVFKATVPLVFVAAVIGFVVYILLFAPKFTEEYSCAMSELRKSSDAASLLGSPIEAGLFATGNFSMSTTGRKANFETSVFGPKGDGTVRARAFRDENTGSNLKVTLETGGNQREIYNGVYPCK